MQALELKDRLNETTKYNADFYNIEAECYDAKNEMFFGEGAKSYSRVKEIIENLANKTNKDVILDIGCGSGYILRAAKNKFKRLIGIDISINMLKKALSHGDSILCGDINYLSVKTDTVDVASAFSVIHHLYSPTLLFNEIYRVLKPAGYFYADNDPNLLAINLHNLNKQSPLYRFCMGFYYLPVRISKNFIDRKNSLKGFCEYLKKSSVSQEKYNELSVKAEHHLDSGLDADVVRQQLLKAGFVDIQIYYHFCGKRFNDGISFFEKINILTKILLKWDFSYLSQQKPLKEFAPYFAFVARKP